MGVGGGVWAMLIVPVSLQEANAFVAAHHRHHGPVAGHKFSIGVAEGDVVHGVAIVGRPVSRHLDDGLTLEVSRICTDGVRNGCSMLYGASWRAARALGYRRLITYTLPSEGGFTSRSRMEIDRIAGRRQLERGVTATD